MRAPHFPSPEGASYPMTPDTFFKKFDQFAAAPGAVAKMRELVLDQRGNRGDLKPYLRNTNVQWMRFQLDDIKELRLAPEELEEFRLQPNDFLICEGGEPGRCAIWRDSHQEMYFQKAIHRVRPRKGRPQKQIFLF
jgi:hypothetical protein